MITELDYGSDSLEENLDTDFYGLQSVGNGEYQSAIGTVESSGDVYRARFVEGDDTVMTDLWLGEYDESGRFCTEELVEREYLSSKSPLDDLPETEEQFSECLVSNFRDYLEQD